MTPRTRSLIYLRFLPLSRHALLKTRSFLVTRPSAEATIVFTIPRWLRHLTELDILILYLQRFMFILLSTTDESRSSCVHSSDAIDASRSILHTFDITNQILLTYQLLTCLIHLVFRTWTLIMRLSPYFISLT